MTYDTINDVQTIAGSGEGTLLANRYRVVRQLGQGGMGSVWLAEDTQLDNKPFAIKMLPSILVSDKRAYRQLKAEALVSMKLVHSNIVPLRGFEENNGNPFLVMDYIDGQTLDDLLMEKEKLTEEETVRILAPVAAALDYAHAKGVVHRDVKPGNVMIAEDGTPYMLDFGIAREIQETMTRVTGRLSSGTLLYMSPEQNNGDEPTAAQDIYSFAAMAYECLAGRPPFTRGNIEDQIKNKIPDPPLGGTQLVASVMAGLAKKPEDRPPTCAAVLEGNGPSRVEHVERVETVEVRVPVRHSFSEGGPRARSVESQPATIGRTSSPSQPSLQERGDFDLKEHKEHKEVGHVAPSVDIARKSTHNKVQLWEGGPYWADTNIGAENPWDYGYYFWWGDIVGYKHENNTWTASDGSSSGFLFSEENTPTYDKNIATLYSGGWIVLGEEKKSFFGTLFDLREDSVLSLKHDAAQMQNGCGWRMPTRQELADLCNKCEWAWTKVNGINGYVVRGRGSYASNSIFLPCAGGGYGTSLYAAGSGGYYWSSVPSSGRSYYAWNLYFHSSGHDTSNDYRNYGQSVRPVQGFTK